MTNFTHLHVHTHYSVLDGLSKIPALVDKAMADGMNAMAITDHGNMSGVKEFFDYATSIISRTEKKINELRESEPTNIRITELTALVEQQRKTPFKPIIGCEVYVAPENRHIKQKTDKPNGYHLVLLAKNKVGYQNLMKLVSLGYIEGFYYKPRIDRELLKKYGEGLIITSACIGGEIPQHIRNNDLVAAEEAMLWYRQHFDDDFYVEIQRHQATNPNANCETFEIQQQVNPQLINLAHKHQVKIIATNDVHFVNEDEAGAHDRLLCINTKKIITDTNRLQNTGQEWFKTQTEMNALFADIPEVLANTCEIVAKVEAYNINHELIMPDFPLPDGFSNEEMYLRHLTYEGAKHRYGDFDETVELRLDFELSTICGMNFQGYFLIVQDVIAATRRMGVGVGPGRGSVAGSIVAYCLGITDIDPMKYDLLFERFLNPDRYSMPDIDIDFEDEGRERVLQWVIEKYGKEKVAHIVTFGTMAAKSAIKDVARVQNLPFSEANRLSELIDEIPFDKKKDIKNAIEYVPAMKEAYQSSNSLIADTIKYAQMLEGTIRQIGVHASGIVIGCDDLANFVPISTMCNEKTNAEILVTQYEGSLIESVGMVKMDFLGLKTPSIIKEAVVNIFRTRGEVVDIDTIPIDDDATYQLYTHGETTGIFQFESEGMKKYLRELKPACFEDLIAMNALYRPGPMDYIPEFIERKHGKKEIVYDIPLMERRLKDTYGVTVYQEQVMLLSRDLAGFTRGQSDELRKAIGKKQVEKMDDLKRKFIDGCKANGHDEKIIEKIWSDWLKFASYAFNKSHAACYSWLAYQTAYLKANYPSEYMAAVLSCNLSKKSEIPKFMQECRRMRIQVLCPDVNQSNQSFTVDNDGNIRFGLAAIKGVAANAVKIIMEERSRNGAFSDIFNFAERVNLTVCNKKSMEALAYAGAFDCFPEITREQFFALTTKNKFFMEELLKYGKSMANLSLRSGNTTSVNRPTIPPAKEMSTFDMTERLMTEKECLGVYLSANPLDFCKSEIDQLTNTTIDGLNNMPIGQGYRVSGIVINFIRKISKRGNPWGEIVLEDISGTYTFSLRGSTYKKFESIVQQGHILLLKGNIVWSDYYSRLEPNIDSVKILGNVRNNLLRGITMTVPLAVVSEEWVSNILAKVNDNRNTHSQGHVKLNFRVVDDGMLVCISPNETTITLDTDFIEFLEQNSKITYKMDWKNF